MNGPNSAICPGAVTWVACSLTLMVTIVALSLLPGDAWIVRVTPQPVQKMLHVAFYAVLAFVLVSAAVEFDMTRRTAIPLIVVGAIALGAVLEWLQSFRPRRFRRMADVIRDAVGVTLGIAIWLLAHP